MTERWPGVRLFIFDADHTLRHTPVPGRVCPLAPGEWALLPGVRETLRRIDWGPDGARLGVASNQDSVGYGHLSADAARDLLADAVRAAVGEIDPPPCLRFCPHVLEMPCGCRKPAPGLLLDILRHFALPPDAALFVGDGETDRRAADAAGIAFAWAWDFFGWPGHPAGWLPPPSHRSASPPG